MLVPSLLLAFGGNVTVAFSPAGDLVIKGDAASNAISINADGEPLGVAPSLGTTINGSSDRFEIQPFTGQLLVDLGAGDDELRVDTSFPHDATIYMGRGDDYLDVYNTSSRVWRVNFGLGDDEARIEDSSFRGMLLVGGSGADGIRLGNAQVRGDCVVRAGAGDDRLTLAHVDFEGRTSLHGGGGVDSIVVDDVTSLAGPPKVTSFESRL